MGSIPGSVVYPRPGIENAMSRRPRFSAAAFGLCASEVGLLRVEGVNVGRDDEIIEKPSWEMST
jgi:hypothetical protein